MAETPDQTTDRIIDQALTADGGADELPEDLFICQTGIVLKLKFVSLETIRSAIGRVPDPEVPTIHDEEKGRDIQNPDSEEYIRAMEAVEKLRNEIVFNIWTVRGTEILSVPEGRYRLDDDGWLEEATDPDVYGGAEYAPEIARAGLGRYRAYLRYYAFGDKDAEDCFAMVRRFSGQVVEGDVTRMGETFRDRQARRSPALRALAAPTARRR